MDGLGEATTASERERVHKRFREQLAEYKSVNAELSDLSWTLAELEQQLAGLAQAPDAQDSKVERRLGDLRRWKESLEENVLRHMYRAEELAASIAEMRRTIADLLENDES